MGLNPPIIELLIKVMSVINADIRKTIIKMTGLANASHVATSLSEVEILNAIYKSIDVKKILNQSLERDRVILSKGHGAAGLYAVMFFHGLLSKEDIESFFSDGSVMAGHASHFIENVEHSTGALGHGLSVGLGMALGARSRGIKNRVFVVVGDGELHEGSNWEAIMYAGHQSVGNLYVLVDKNGKTMTGNTAEECSVDPLADKFRAFNFKTIEIEDGHDESQIINGIEESRDSNSPVAIICNTIKGKGISFMESNLDWHYRPPQGEDLAKAIAELEEK